MTPHPLPDRPNLEQLKKQAKSLLRAAQDARRRGAPATVPRCRRSPRARPTQIASADLALHDAQSVIAREHGFASWNALREEVEARTLSFDAAVDEFVRCATGGASGRAERLLALHPGIASATLHTALVLGDAAAVEARLARQPDARDRTGGPQDWEPLLYVCHTCMHRTAPARVDGLVAIARALLRARRESERRVSLELASRAAAHGAVGRGLRRPASAARRGAARGRRESDRRRHDAHRRRRRQSRRARAAAPLRPRRERHPRRRAAARLHDAVGDNPAGPLWLLEHGADPNLAWGDDGRSAAARRGAPMGRGRWSSGSSQHGADPSRRRADGATPHTLAELHGNHDIAVVAARARRDRRALAARTVHRRVRARPIAPPRDAMLAAHPGLRAELRPEHHLMLQRHAESGNIAALETMLACGFDPNVRDKDRVTALHRAAMGGSGRGRARAAGARRRHQRARRHVRGDAARLGRRGAHACASRRRSRRPSRGR